MLVLTHNPSTYHTLQNDMANLQRIKHLETRIESVVGKIERGETHSVLVVIELKNMHKELGEFRKDCVVSSARDRHL